MLVSEIDSRQVFKRGDRVQVSTRGCVAQIFPGKKIAPTNGRVVGFSRQIRYCVRIVRAGQKSAGVYAWWFWEREGSNEF